MSGIINSAGSKSGIVGTVETSVKNMIAYRASGESTPSGWSEYTTARGRMIVGLPSGGSDGGTLGTVFTDIQDKEDDLAHDHTSTAHVHGVFYMDITAATLRYATFGRFGTTGGTFNPDRGISSAGSADTGLGIPTTESVTPNNTGSTSGTDVTTKTSHLLAYIQLMAIKKD